MCSHITAIKERTNMFSVTCLITAFVILILGSPGYSAVTKPPNQGTDPTAKPDTSGKTPSWTSKAPSTTKTTPSSRYKDTDYKYAVVIDAGSTGSRARVYRWLPEELTGYGLPEIREINDSKSEPGVSKFANDKEKLEGHVGRLVRDSVPHVPKKLHSMTPIYFMATAGMRLLLEDNAFTALQYIQDILSNKSVNPFWFEYSENARILSGEEEGVFAWIAVNYLAGTFTPDGLDYNNLFNPIRWHKTIKTFSEFIGDLQAEPYGILELGGASTQIAFVPKGDILADKFPVQIGRKVHSLYVHSYLHYGQKYVDLWIKDQLCQANNCFNKSLTINNPCMLIDDEQYNVTEDGTRTTKFVGSGDPAACSKMLHELVYKAAEDWQCFPKPCAIGTIYQPTIQPHFKFYALGAFMYSLKSIGIMAADGSMTPANTTKAAFEFCKKPMKSMSLYRPGKKNFLSTECLMGLYMPILFSKGYGFSEDSKQIQVAKEIKGHQIEWPLGAVIYENERRSCKHCPGLGGSVGCAVTSQANSHLMMSHHMTSLMGGAIITSALWKMGGVYFNV